jgi:hypothetical protein
MHTILTITPMETTKTAKERAKELVDKYGVHTAIVVADEILNRDKQWIEKLCRDYPTGGVPSSERWELSDFDKSVTMFHELKHEIFSLQVNQ